MPSYWSVGSHCYHLYKLGWSLAGLRWTAVAADLRAPDSSWAGTSFQTIGLCWRRRLPPPTSVWCPRRPAGAEAGALSRPQTRRHSPVHALPRISVERRRGACDVLDIRPGTVSPEHVGAQVQAGWLTRAIEGAKGRLVPRIHGQEVHRTGRSNFSPTGTSSGLHHGDRRCIHDPWMVVGYLLRRYSCGPAT